MVSKPTNGRAYGSIAHLPGSYVSRGDKHVCDGQAKILTEKCRKDDLIVVTEKLDGTCVAVCKINGELVPIQRKGYPCWSSPHSMHGMFATWVKQNEDRLHPILDEGERLVGEWIIQAHGTRYELHGKAEPFVPFDLFTADNNRLTYDDMCVRLFWEGCERPIEPVRLMYVGRRAVPIESVICWRFGGWSNPNRIWPVEGESPEGVVYRCERGDKVLFLAKWVRNGYVPGKYMPQSVNENPVWNCDISGLLPAKKVEVTV